MRDVLGALRPELEKGNARLVVRTILKFIHTLQERDDETMCDDDYMDLADLHEEFAEMLEACAKLESWPLKEKRELLEELRRRPTTAFTGSMISTQWTRYTLMSCSPRCLWRRHTLN